MIDLAWADLSSLSPKSQTAQRNPASFRLQLGLTLKRGEASLTFKNAKQNPPPKKATLKL